MSEVRNCKRCSSPLIPDEDWPGDYQRWKIYYHQTCNQKQAQEGAGISNAIRRAVEVGEGLTRGAYAALDAEEKKRLRQKYKDGSWQKDCKGCGEPLIVGEDYPEEYLGWSIYYHQTCNQDQTDSLRHFYTIKMPDGTIEDWVETKRGFMDQGGKITATWSQDRPGDKWPTRKEKLTGILAKSNGKPTLNSKGEPVNERTVPNQQVKQKSETRPKKDPEYVGVSWGHDLDSELAKMKLSGTQTKRAPKSSTERFTDFGTTKSNSPTFIIRDQQPGAIYAIRPYPEDDWYIKIGMLGADSPDRRLRSDYEKNLPPRVRALMNYDLMGYLDLYVASAERQLRNTLKHYAQQDGNRKDFFIFSPLVPLTEIDALLEQIIFRDIGAMAV